MNDYPRKHPSHECPPPPEYPADQPNLPGDGSECGALEPTRPPELLPPTECPKREPGCKCPTEPGPNHNCLEDLIAKHAKEAAAAEQANKLKDQLTLLLKSAKDASQKYTRDLYDKWVEDWVKQDYALADLIRKLVCAVPCWHCILECYVCPLLNELHYAEKWLYNDGHLYSKVYDLYDLRYWHEQYKVAKDRQLAQITTVLKAWESPATAIPAALKKVDDLIEANCKFIGCEPGKAFYDIFVIAVQLHLAIAPPASEDGPVTKIDKKYTDFCICLKGDPDACCGPDVGVQSLLRRVIGPQPYLIDPNDYFKLICCLIDKRLLPAQAQASAAENDLNAVKSRIERYEKQLGPGWIEDFKTKVGAAIPSVINCCNYEPDHGSGKSAS
jgi:hypothetical protein